MAIHSGLRLATAAALAGPPRRWRHGAVILKKSKVIAAGYNEQFKTNAAAKRWFPWGFPHAELSACLKAGFDNCHGASLIVVRLMADNSIGQSCPCQNCQQMLRDLGVKHVWFSNDQGLLEKL